MIYNSKVLLAIGFLFIMELAAMGFEENTGILRNSNQKRLARLSKRKLNVNVRSLVTIPPFYAGSSLVSAGSYDPYEHY
uniref:Uncharacterized protein n=1 Tax=Phakopsora pachyrhizi TaxID=170000 RepID=A0A0S1MJG3_PHAPC